jgi:hypothetical protein
VVLRLWQEEMNWVLEAAERHKKGFGHQALCKSLGRQEQSQPRPESAFARTAKSERTPERKANTVD